MTTEKVEREHFITYLRQTLIPDLLESGHGATAQDFETACRFMDTEEDIAMIVNVPVNESDIEQYVNAWKVRYPMQIKVGQDTYNCQLLDDGTPDTVVTINGEIHRVEQEAATDYRDGFCTLNNDGFRRLCIDIITGAL